MYKKRRLTPDQQNQREEFLIWVETEMDLRGINAGMLAAEGDISPALVSMTLGRKLSTGYGPKFVAAVAAAFNLPEIDLFQRAGLVAGPAEESGAPAQIAESARRLTADNQAKLLEYSEYLYIQQEQKRQANNNLANRINRLDPLSQQRIVAAGDALARTKSSQPTSLIELPVRPD